MGMKCKVFMYHRGVSMYLKECSPITTLFLLIVSYLFHFCHIIMPLIECIPFIALYCIEDEFDNNMISFHSIALLKFKFKSSQETHERSIYTSIKAFFYRNFHNFRREYTKFRKISAVYQRMIVIELWSFWKFINKLHLISGFKDRVSATQYFLCENEAGAPPSWNRIEALLP